MSLDIVALNAITTDPLKKLAYSLEDKLHLSLKDLAQYLKNIYGLYSQRNNPWKACAEFSQSMNDL